jgi:hypothetical protein
LWSCGHHSLPHTPSSHVLLMPNSQHLTHGINNFVSLITKTKLELLDYPCYLYTKNITHMHVSTLATVEIYHSDWYLNSLTTLGMHLGSYC